MLIKLRFSAQSCVDNVGAIIDRPAHKCFEFAEIRCEIATFCGIGRSLSAPTFKIETDH